MCLSTFLCNLVFLENLGSCFKFEIKLCGIEHHYNFYTTIMSLRLSISVQGYLSVITYLTHINNRQDINRHKINIFYASLRTTFHVTQCVMSLGNV